MANFNSSNVYYPRGYIFSSGHGGLTINNVNGDPEFGMHDSMSVLKRTYRWPYEGLNTLRLGVSLGAIHDSSERYPPPNCHPDTRKAFERLSYTGSIAKVWHLFSGFTDLQVPVRRRFFKQLQSFCAVHPNPMRTLAAAFSSLEERKGVMKVIFCSQQSHINSLWKYLDYDNTSIILWN